MKSSEFVEKLLLATTVKSMYISDCFGAPMTRQNKNYYKNHTDYNKKHASQIEACSEDTFGFDCVNLLKGILWGWNADLTKQYGGAVYQSNDVPDCTTGTFANSCSDLTDDWSVELDPGEIVWMSGHIGAYIGNGLCVECTPKWQNKVQITALGNKGTVPGYNTRTWTKHGHTKWLEYDSLPPYKVGDVVNFRGGKCFLTANGSIGSEKKNGDVTITKIADLENYKHPYYISATKNSHSNAKGWVDKELIEPNPYTPPTKQCTVTISQVQRGNQCNDVRILQKILNLEADGKFGPATETAVKNFQKNQSLYVDGIAGPKTWAKLIEYFGDN